MEIEMKFLFLKPIKKRVKDDFLVLPVQVKQNLPIEKDLAQASVFQHNCFIGSGFEI